VRRRGKAAGSFRIEGWGRMRSVCRNHPPMKFPSRLLRVVAGLSLAASLLNPVSAKTSTLADFQAQAAAAKSSLALPVYPLTPAEIKAQAEGAIKAADAAFATLAAQDPATLTFANTF